MQLVVRDVADLFNVSEKTVYRWIAQGEIPAYRVNKQYRFSRAELLEWATRRRLNVSPRVVAEAPGEEGTPPTAVDALEAGGIVYRLEGADKQAVLRAMVSQLRVPEDVDRDTLLEFLLAREELASTGIGDGIAIPHVRNPIVVSAGKPSITLCFLEKPVDFDALDGKPVKRMFALVSPTVRTHLHLLSRLAFLLMQPVFRQAVLDEGSRQQIMAAAREAEASMAVGPEVKR